VADNENRYAATEQEAQVLACSTSFLLGCSFRADHLPFVFLSSVKRPKCRQGKSPVFISSVKRPKGEQRMMDRTWLLMTSCAYHEYGYYEV
jgi:hypothetical protein